MRSSWMQRLEKLRLSLRQHHGTAWIHPTRHQSLATGVGIHHRPYIVGDDPRRINWAVYGRTDRLVIRQAQPDQVARVFLMIDTSASMLHPREKWPLVQEVALAFGYLTLSRGGEVWLGFVGPEQTTLHGPYQGVHQLGRIEKKLREIRPQGLTSWEHSLYAFAQKTKQPGTVLLLSDGYAPDIEVGLRWLRGPLFARRVLQISAADENPPIEGDVDWNDAETGAIIRWNGTPETQKAYETAHRNYLLSVTEQARRQGAYVIQASPCWSMERIVLHALSQTSWLK